MSVPEECVHQIAAVLGEINDPTTPSIIRDFLVTHQMANNSPELEGEIFDVMLHNPAVFILLPFGKWGLQIWANQVDNEVFRYVFASKHGGIWSQIGGEWTWTATEKPTTSATDTETTQLEAPRSSHDLKFHVRAIIRADYQAVAPSAEQALSNIQGKIEAAGNRLIDVMVIEGE